MNSKVLFTLCFLVVAASAIPQPIVPGWTNPWIPQWQPCTTVGSACSDCTTKSICTPIGGITKACSDPTLPYCNLGECSATPTAGCASGPQAPAVIA
ncbi:uncharacterized protein LOC128675161 [Plodia interpunctella]|uniref:uncharacterized protein LOC128675161 n=1 Tax=Plodia interpunctella TaxID=58824 RepID=UPI002368D74F|nr:uncharacterized protein LOC128675161 [Plodia interpunctella]